MTTTAFHSLVLASAFAGCLGSASIAGAQNRGILTGQDVAPVFEGWQRQPDGTITMWFGYFNRNFEQEVDVPIGAANAFEPGTDRGQPTHFMPRRQRFVFTVSLPKDWPKEQRVIWTLTANGKTEKAQGWLQPEWEVDDGVIQMNMGPGGAPPDPPNHRPTISGGPSSLQATVAEALTLTASATDDGSPKPRRPRKNEPAEGLTIRWIEYRGPGSVSFTSARTGAAYGQPIEAKTEVRFSAPGDYWLRAIASDSLLESTWDVKVAVSPH